MPSVEVTGDKLRAGMVLVDELGCPSAGLDHKTRAPRNSGAVAFLAYDFDNRSLVTLTLTVRRTYRVVAA